MIVCDLLLPPLRLLGVVPLGLRVPPVPGGQVARGLDDVQFVSLSQNFGPVLVIFFLLYILVRCCLIFDNNCSLSDVVLCLSWLSVAVVVCPGLTVSVHHVLHLAGDLDPVQSAREAVGAVRLADAVLDPGHLLGLLVLVLLGRHVVQQLLLELQAVHAVLAGDVHHGLLGVEPPELVTLKQHNM